MEQITITMMSEDDVMLELGSVSQLNYMHRNHSRNILKLLLFAIQKGADQMAFAFINTCHYKGLVSKVRLVQCWNLLAFNWEDEIVFALRLFFNCK